ncbi:DoxX family protein [Microbulbifer sp. GL-2]|uniref:DoxX family protein n=1 Tax=Microbulbifer sp. GL-2 TaxID=2591606 RepID=UPI0011622C69|nr:DoxX family protein [Microbulbifer sp. GL-2]BBM01947.1 membrane protein [Microbulbifer sp. GL-2]
MTTSTLTTAQDTSSLFPTAADLAGRIGLSAIFLLAGINKIQNYEGSAQYLVYGGLPESLLPLVILFEVGTALALISGFQVRLVALALAGFSVVTAALYHNNLADQMQFIMFFKNIAMAGGFLLLAANGAGRWSLDARSRRSQR